MLKTVLLAFTWAYVTVFIPLHKSYLFLRHSELFVFNRRFLFMVMLCIIFDNRDKAVDKIRGLHSLATVLKPAHLRIFIYLITIEDFLSLQKIQKKHSYPLIQKSTLKKFFASKKRAQSRQIHQLVSERSAGRFGIPLASPSPAHATK